MQANLQQKFPTKVNGQIVHKSWTVDIESALKLQKGSGLKADRLKREVADMNRHFPRWVLTIGRKDQRVTCAKCSGMLVFDRGLRCAVCNTRSNIKHRSKQAGLAWFGLMPPVGIDGLRKVKAGLLKRQPKHHIVGQREDLGHFLLVPLIATYPESFPRSPIEVYYLPTFFKIQGVPRKGASHQYHMLGGGQMCLYAGGEWHHQTSCRKVLQQRAYAHVIKLLNFANGKKRAFAIVS